MDGPPQPSLHRTMHSEETSSEELPYSVFGANPMHKKKLDSHKNTLCNSFAALLFFMISVAAISSHCSLKADKKAVVCASPMLVFEEGGNGIVLYKLIVSPAFKDKMTVMLVKVLAAPVARVISTGTGFKLTFKPKEAVAVPPV